MSQSQSPILRVLVDGGSAYDDPSEDLLFMLLEEDMEQLEGSLVTVELLSDPTGQTYASARRLEDDRYRLEHREGIAEPPFVTTVPDSLAAHEFLTAWAFALPSWRELPWRPVTL